MRGPDCGGAEGKPLIDSIICEDFTTVPESDGLHPGPWLSCFYVVRKRLRGLASQGSRRQSHGWPGPWKTSPPGIQAQSSGCRALWWQYHNFKVKGGSDGRVQNKVSMYSERCTGQPGWHRGAGAVPTRLPVHLSLYTLTLFWTLPSLPPLTLKLWYCHHSQWLTLVQRFPTLK